VRRQSPREFVGGSVIFEFYPSKRKSHNLRLNTDPSDHVASGVGLNPAIAEYGNSTACRPKIRQATPILNELGKR
jgi:hypothetical protein